MFLFLPQFAVLPFALFRLALPITSVPPASPRQRFLFLYLP
jgi:hypothetical protein